MENFKSHKREIFWYIIHVPRERSGMFFDIGGWHHVPAIGPKPVWADGKTPVGRDHRAHRPGELRKRIRRPRHVRNSVLVLPRKPLLSTDEARIRCCAAWQSCGATSFPLLRPGS